MSSREVCLLLLYQFTIVCHGSNNQLSGRYDLTKLVYDKSLLPSGMTSHVKSRSFLHCCTLCQASADCKGVAYSDNVCWFVNVTKTACQMFKGECSTCSYKVMMDSFSPHPSDCKSLLEQGHTEDGVYAINPPGSAPFQAFCDMSGGGWTVIQRRVDDTVDFYRTYAEYATGFGDLFGNFWAGLDNIHAVTSTEQHTELLVTMDTFEGESAVAHYCSFSVGDAASGYLLSVGGYSGTAGNSFGGHNGRQFSTYDKDQDTNSGSCAVSYRGGWWYSSCHGCNPNGLYLHGTTTLYAKGVVWSAFKGHYYSLKTIDFKVRRVF